MIRPGFSTEINRDPSGDWITFLTRPESLSNTVSSVTEFPFITHLYSFCDASPPTSKLPFQDLKLSPEIKVAPEVPMEGVKE